MKTLIKTSHGVAVLAACLLLAFVFIIQTARNFDQIAKLVPIESQLALLTPTATLRLSPDTNSVKVGSTFTVNILLNTGGQSTYGVDINSLRFMPNILQVVDVDTVMAGIQIAPGTLMTQTIINNVDNSAGTIQFSQLADPGLTYSSSGTLASITFKVIAVGTSNVFFDFIQGNGTDSNVAGFEGDLLSSVSGASYIGVADTSSPVVTTPVTTIIPSHGDGVRSSGGATMYPLNILFTGNGSGTVKSTPAGINCGKTNTSGCSYSFYANSTVLLTASPNASSSLASWVGCTSLVGTSTCSMTMVQAKSVTATFVPGKTTAVVTNTPVITNPNVTSAMTVKAKPNITRWLNVGSSGSDVLQLQKALNQNGYAIVGQGSPNNESTYFGPSTAVAVGRFQCAKLQVCQGSPETNGYGVVGPRTRQALSLLTISLSTCPVGMNCVPNTTQTPITTIPSTIQPLGQTSGNQLPVTSSQFTRSLTLGSTGSDVKALQVFLNSKGFTVSTTGAGSKGQESTYFGPATQRAVIKFQIANNITPAVGYFGPVTRSYIK